MYIGQNEMRSLLTLIRQRYISRRRATPISHKTLHIHLIASADHCYIDDRTHGVVPELSKHDACREHGMATAPSAPKLEFSTLFGFALRLTGET